jgi:hypothetical protein
MNFAWSVLTVTFPGTEAVQPPASVMPVSDNMVLLPEVLA